MKSKPIEQAARLEKPERKFPWEAVIASAAVAAAAYGAYQFGKTDDAPRVSPAAPPRHAPAPPPPVERKPPPRGLNLGAYGGASTTELIVLAGDNSRTFLGCLTCSEFDTSSIRNDYGLHSKYGGESIRNQYSQYGSPYAHTSACNPYATEPPIIVDRDGGYYGELTMNQYRPNRTRMQSALVWLAAACQAR